MVWVPCFGFLLISHRSRSATKPDHPFERHLVRKALPSHIHSQSLHMPHGGKGDGGNSPSVLSCGLEEEPPRRNHQGETVAEQLFLMQSRQVPVLGLKVSPQPVRAAGAFGCISCFIDSLSHRPVGAKAGALTSQGEWIVLQQVLASLAEPGLT